MFWRKTHMVQVQGLAFEHALAAFAIYAHLLLPRHICARGE